MHTFNPNQDIDDDQLEENFKGLAEGTEITDHAITTRHFQIDTWHEVGGTGEPAYENSWVSYDSNNYYGAQFMKDAYGFVYLRGLVKSGTIGATIFTLPEGYRPAYRHIFGIQTNSSFNRLDVDETGYVLANGSNAWVSLGGIKFQAGG